MHFSIRHTTRNFPNREGSKLQNGQISSVALMDARSIAATAANKGFLTSATEFRRRVQRTEISSLTKRFTRTVYSTAKVWQIRAVEIQFGPNIKDWPEMPALARESGTEGSIRDSRSGNHHR